MCMSAGVSAEIVNGWKINAADGSDPLLFVHKGKTLHALKGLGPVFAVDDGKIGPADYRVTSTSKTNADGSVVIACKASMEDFSADYTLTFRPLPGGAMEMIVQGPANVASFQCGRIVGASQPIKQFYVGQRDVEAYSGNDGAAPFLYWAEANLFLFAPIDLNVSHSGGYDHRAMPKKNFLAVDPPISCDTGYAILTDGTRPTLYERYVFRAATDLWEVAGPLPTKPSQYRDELATMIFNDYWHDSFKVGTATLEWLKKVTADRMKFYTVIEQWGFAGFDDALPDLYRAKDANVPCARYGTKDDLKKFVAVGNSMGRTALRTNYILVRPEASFSVKEGLAKAALNADKTPKWHSNFTTMLPLIERQDGEFHRDFGTTAAFSDQLSSGGHSGGYVNCDASEPGAGTIAAARKNLREMCAMMKKIHQGPLGSESYIADFQFGEFMDTGDYQLFAGDTRNDFTPEEKLRRIQPLTVTHSMGLGYRYFFGPWEKDWMGRGCTLYFGDDEKQDSYRACEILYGNGGYLFFYPCMKRVQALTECFTVGVAQRAYALQTVDYVKYGKGGLWKTLPALITNPAMDSLDKLHSWFKRFHIRYANGCHVYVNRDTAVMTVETPNRTTIKLPQNGWLVFTEDGNLLAYTALVSDPYFPSRESRVDFCEDKARKIKYINPRGTHFGGITQPTVWLDDKVHFVQEHIDETFDSIAK